MPRVPCKILRDRDWSATSIFRASSAAAHIECFEFFSQVFTRMDSSECHSNAPSDSRQSPRFDGPRRSVSPLEANSAIDRLLRMLVLTLAVTYQRFQKRFSRQTRRDRSSRLAASRRFKLQAARDRSKPENAFDPLTAGEFSGSLIPIADDHYL